MKYLSLMRFMNQPIPSKSISVYKENGVVFQPEERQEVQVVIDASIFYDLLLEEILENGYVVILQTHILWEC